jgi:uncharacterized membrane protein YphA (DoxX/SURF4 family)
MQRLYPTFPGSTPGLALLLLRAALGGTLLVACETSSVIPEAGWRAVVSGVLAGASGVAILLGVVTPFAAITGLLAIVLTLHWSADSTGSVLGEKLEILRVGLVATALALLGPGAFSIDARLFGRREMSFPPDPPREDRSD